MKIYNFKRSGLFTHESEASLDPLETEKRKKLYKAELTIINRMEGIDGDEKANLISKLKAPVDAFIVPADATTEAPPELEVNEVAFFVDGKWAKVNDQRGQVYHIPGERQEFVVEGFGDLPEGAVLGKRTIEGDEKWEVVRSTRNGLLNESDWMVLPDSPVEDNIPVMAYRQKLRDIPQDFTDPEKVVFPKMV